MRNRPNYCDGRRIAMLLFAVTMMLTVAGCGSKNTAKKDSPVVAPQTWQQQIDEVRAGRSDQVEVAAELISDDNLTALAGLRGLRVLLLDKAAVSDTGVERLSERILIPDDDRLGRGVR